MVLTSVIALIWVAITDRPTAHHGNERDMRDVCLTLTVPRGLDDRRRSGTEQVFDDEIDIVDHTATGTDRVNLRLYPDTIGPGSNARP